MKNAILALACAVAGLIVPLHALPQSTTPSGSQSPPAQSSAGKLQALAAALPKCALLCITKYTSQSTCAVTDLPCVCQNQALNAQITLCIKASCNVEEALTSKNATSVACGLPIRDRTYVDHTVTTVFYFVALIACILRFIARPPWTDKFLYDDGFIAAALVMATVMLGISWNSNHLGLGKDIWTLPFDHIEKILRNFYISEQFYLAAIMFTKISMLFLYLRIFTSPTFRKIVYLVIAICVCYDLAIIPTALFQCTPVRYAWKQWRRDGSGKCIDANAFIWALSSVNIALDVTTIILPIPQILKLSTTIKRKIQLSLMFCVGFFITFVSIYRLRYLVKFANTENPTWDYLKIGYWSNLEIMISIFCASMPAVAQFYRQVLPKWFPRMASGSASTGRYAQQDPPSEQKRRSPWDTPSGITKTVESSVFKLTTTGSASRGEHDREVLVPQNTFYV